MKWDMRWSAGVAVVVKDGRYPHIDTKAGSSG
jgi:hypothetical protein